MSHSLFQKIFTVLETILKKGNEKKKSELF